MATWEEHGGQTGPERCFTQDGYLNMEFIYDTAVGFLSAAIQTRDEFLYGRWEARLKPSDVPGVLNSFYTIDWNDTSDNSSNSNGTKQEIDIEFLTYSFDINYGEVHYAVHASGLTSFNTNPDIQLDFNPSDDFHIWGFEITPEQIQWFVDSTILQTYIYSENDISITSPYQLKLNVWSAENWINGPPELYVVCTYLIDWIRFTPWQSTDNPEKKAESIRILHNSPNPFDVSTSVHYSLSKATSVSFLLYDATGKIIHYIDRDHTTPGNYTIQIDGTKLQPGVYFYSIITPEECCTKKCVVLRK